MSRGPALLPLIACGLAVVGFGSGCRASSAPATEPTTPPAPVTLELQQPPVEQGEVWGPQDEANAEAVRKIFHDTLIKDTGDDPVMRRDAHPKHHACVKGTLAIDPSALPPEYRVGLFAAAGQYQAWVRFSNGDTNPTLPDPKPNFRGMAVKILQVPYSSYLADIGHESDNPVHDLLLLNSPNFFVKDSAQYVEFMTMVDKGGAPLAGYSVAHERNNRIIQKARRMKVANVLDLDYHSATPYKLGPTSMRMTMASCKATKDELPPEPPPNFLAERLEADLAAAEPTAEPCFVFRVQPNEDPQTNDIEDPRILWDEQQSPQVEVGRLTLMQQSGVRAPEQMQLCEQMTFNPWRAPAENRPMGQANRVRLEVYARQSRMRNEHNRVVEPRPTGF